MLKRRWNENYVEFGFIKKFGKDGTEKAQRILCDQVLTNSSSRLSKLKIHFATRGGLAVYGIEALKEKRTSSDQKKHSSSVAQKTPQSKSRCCRRQIELLT